MKRVRVTAFVLAVALLPAAGTVVASDAAFDVDPLIAEGARHHAVTLDEYTKALAEQDKSQPLIDLVRGNPREFSDIYFDWEAPDPSFVVQYLGDSAPEVDTDIPHRLVRVEHSYADLESALEVLAAMAKQGDPRETGFVSVGIDTVSNTVAVAVDRADAPFARQADAYGSMVSVSVQEPAVSHQCNSRFDCTGLRGGLYMVGNTYACSTGFNARRLNGNKVHVSSGHCDWQTTSTWDHPNTQGVPSLIGVSALNGLHNGRDTDVLRIRIDADPRMLPYTWNILYNSATQLRRDLNLQVDNSGMYNGMAVNKSGVSTNTTVGSITGGRHLISYDIAGWPRFHWVYPASYAGQPGDSGGTVWRGTSTSQFATLVGIHSGEAGNNRVFASQQDARTVLNVSWCLNSSCN